MATSKKGGIVDGVITNKNSAIRSGKSLAGKTSDIPGSPLNSVKLFGRPLAGSIMLLGEITDNFPPQLSALSPSAGSPIYTNTAIQFTISDDKNLRLVEIQVDQTTREVIFDGDIFLYPYLASTRTATTGGFTFQIVRFGGWSSAPRFHVRAFDSAFNEPSPP